MKLLVISGISGCGKTTYVGSLGERSWETPSHDDVLGHGIVPNELEAKWAAVFPPGAPFNAERQTPASGGSREVRRHFLSQSACADCWPRWRGRPATRQVSWSSEVEQSSVLAYRLCQGAAESRTAEQVESGLSYAERATVGSMPSPFAVAEGCVRFLNPEVRKGRSRSLGRPQGLRAKAISRLD
jgi:hypothetical protein